MSRSKQGTGHQVGYRRPPREHQFKKGSLPAIPKVGRRKGRLQQQRSRRLLRGR